MICVTGQNASYVCPLFASHNPSTTPTASLTDPPLTYIYHLIFSSLNRSLLREYPHNFTVPPLPYLSTMDDLVPDPRVSRILTPMADQESNVNRMIEVLKGVLRDLGDEEGGDEAGDNEAGDDEVGDDEAADDEAEAVHEDNVNSESTTQHRRQRTTIPLLIHAYQTLIDLLPPLKWIYPNQISRTSSGLARNVLARDVDDGKGDIVDTARKWRKSPGHCKRVQFLTFELRGIGVGSR